MIKLRVYEPGDIKKAQKLIGEKVFYGDFLGTLSIGEKAKLIDIDENDSKNPYIVYPTTEVKWKYIAVEI